MTHELSFLDVMEQPDQADIEAEREERPAKKHLQHIDRGPCTCIRTGPFVLSPTPGDDKDMCEPQVYHFIRP